MLSLECDVCEHLTYVKCQGQGRRHIQTSDLLMGAKAKGALGELLSDAAVIFGLAATILETPVK